MLKANKENIDFQIHNIKSVWPNASINRTGNFGFSWNLHLQPKTKSRIYSINITYVPNDRPHVRVLLPNLIIPSSGEERRKIHYNFDETLCLYSPGEWHNNDNITDLIPWTCEWLIYYETWLITGEWKGDIKN